MTPLRRVAVGAVGVAGVLALLTLTPSSLGGTATWVVTQGISMEPGVHEGDLVIARPRSAYEVGDVVAYPSDTLSRTVVLHRIVDRAPTGHVTQGDNNSWLDPDTPTDHEILGALWLHIPSGGKVLTVFSDPTVIVALVVAVALLGWLATAPVRRRRRRGGGHQRPGTPPTRPWPIPVHRSHVAGLAIVAVLLGLYAFTRPATEPTTREVPLTHTVTTEYEATVRPTDLYPEGRVRTGDPVFLREAPKIELVTRYTAPPEADGVSGTAQAHAVLRASNGWERRVPLAAATPLEEEQRTAVDLRHLLDLVRAAEEVAGTSLGSVTVDLVTAIDTAGTVESQRIAYTADPTVTLTLTEAAATMAGESGTGAEQLAVTVPATTTVHAHVLSWAVPVTWLRALAVLLLALTAVGLVGLRRGGPADADEAILRPRLVSAVQYPTQPRTIVDVIDARALRTIADRYDEVVLSVTDETGSAYLVHSGDLAYRYRPGTPHRSGGAEPLPSALKTTSPPGR